MGNAWSYKSDLVSACGTGGSYAFEFTALGLLGPGKLPVDYPGTCHF